MRRKNQVRRKYMGKIKYLVMDVDGTLTDGKIYIGNDGELMKAFDVKDGYAISKILPKYGIIPIIITGRHSKIVENRCKELAIEEVHQNCNDKSEKLIEIIERISGKHIETDYIVGCASVGDDIPDIAMMNISEISGCPVDACKNVKKHATYVCKKGGGAGAVREFIEWIVDCYERGIDK